MPKPWLYFGEVLLIWLYANYIYIYYYIFYQIFWWNYLNNSKLSLKNHHQLRQLGQWWIFFMKCWKNMYFLFISVLWNLSLFALYHFSIYVPACCLSSLILIWQKCSGVGQLSQSLGRDSKQEHSVCHSTNEIPTDENMIHPPLLEPCRTWAFTVLCSLFASISIIVAWHDTCVKECVIQSKGLCFWMSVS